MYALLRDHLAHPSASRTHRAGRRGRTFLSAKWPPRAGCICSLYAVSSSGQPRTSQGLSHFAKAETEAPPPPFYLTPVPPLPPKLSRGVELETLSIVLKSLLIRALATPCPSWNSECHREVERDQEKSIVITVPVLASCVSDLTLIWAFLSPFLCQASF